MKEWNIYQRAIDVFNRHVNPDIYQGSATDPILQNAKETGGIGYTEGEVTTITWDGDTSGLVSVGDILYKVANYTEVNKSDLIGGIISLQNDDTHPTPFVIEENEINDTFVPNAILIGDYAIFVSEPTSFDMYNFAEPGIYFAKTGTRYTESLTYGNETIHKIDEKYLPSSGAMMVTVDYDAGGVLRANKTFTEIESAIKSGLDVNCFVEQKYIARLSGYYFKE